MKKPEKPEEVVDACVDLEKFWEPRDRRAKAAMKLYHMYDEEEIAKKKDSRAYYISNETRTLADTVVSLVSRKTPWPRIPVTSEDREARSEISTIERGVIGLTRMADEKMRRAWRGDGIAALCAKNAVLRGWWGACKLLVDDPEGSGQVSIRMFDPLEFYPQLGADEPPRIIHKYLTTVSEVENNWGDNYKKTEEKIEEVTVYDDWFYGDKGEVINDVVVEDKVSGSLLRNKNKRGQYTHYVKKPTIVSGLKRLPIIMGPVVGSTFRKDEVSGVDWQAAIGQDVYAMNVSLSKDGGNLYSQYNKYMSYMLEMVDKAATRGLIGKSPAGDMTADRIDERAGGFTSLKTAESIEGMPYVTTPVEINRIAADLAGQLQRGGISWALTGQVPFEMSGYALDKLVAAALVTLNAYVVAQKCFFTELWQTFLEQFKERGTKPITFFGEMRNGKLFEQDFTPDLLKKKYFIDVDLTAALPEDEAKKAEIAARWKQVGIDTYTIMEEVLKLQDPDMLDERKLREVAMGLEPIALRRLEAAFKAVGETEKAEFISQYRMMKEIAMKAEFETMMNKIMGQYQQIGGAPGGMRPGTLPPEAAGMPEGEAPPGPPPPGAVPNMGGAAPPMM